MKAIPALLGLILIFDFALAEDLDVLSFDEEETLVEDVTSSVEPVSKEPVAATPEPTPAVKTVEPIQEPVKAAEPAKAAEPVKMEAPAQEKKNEKATEAKSAQEAKTQEVKEVQEIVPTPEPSETATITSPVITVVEEPKKTISCKDSPIVKKINTEVPSFGCFEVLPDGKLKIKYKRQTASIERQALDVKVTYETPKTTEKTVYSFKTDKDKRILSIKSKKISNENPPENDLAKLDYDEAGNCIDVTTGGT